jgi:glycolate oxidase FAD binding subunit
VLPSVVSDTVEAIGRTTGETELRPAVIAHPAYGRVHVSWFDEEDALSDDVAVRVLRDTREAVHDLGGSLLVERCPLQVKGRLDVWDEVGESLGVMRRMKRQYDSRGVLNPGRFVGGI